MLPLDSFAQLFEDELSHWVSALKVTETVKNAVSYALFSGGKRIRPRFVAALALDLGQSELRPLIGPCIGLELCHTASLIHDDLPSLDNDDLRRGQPTVHKQFGESTAVLTGDLMIAASFHAATLSDLAPSDLLKTIRGLALAFVELCDGQVMDLERKVPLETIHALKTGALFRCAGLIAGVCSGLPEADVTLAANFGLALGLYFQAVDDCLDGELAVESPFVADSMRRVFFALEALERARGLILKNAREIAEAVRCQLKNEKARSQSFLPARDRA